MGLQYEAAVAEGRRFAEKFGHRLRDGETDDEFRDRFRHFFWLTFTAAKYKKNNKEATLAYVDDNVAQLEPIRLAMSGQNTTTGVQTRRQIAGGREHLTSYRTAPVTGNYVTFSDIHLTNRDNRQSFFETSGNKALYMRVLRDYYAERNFGLIENGDIEELLIFEPAAPEHQNMPNFSDIVWDEPDTWQGIFADRTLRKRVQFETIVNEHADYYRLIDDLFLSRGMYWRTIGNHDTDLADPDYRDYVRDTLDINWPTASDLFGLTDQEGQLSVLFCHGHQFDASCTAEHAPYTGESLSQGGAWAYEGPDRAWNLEDDGDEFIWPWLEGSKPFNNYIVSAEHAGKDQVANAIWAFLGVPLHDTDKWEAIFTGPIAWEYFLNEDPQEAFDEEVRSGARWLKLRHMDEDVIVRGMDSAWGRNSGPKLVLGHSHEPRLNAARSESYIDEMPIATHYLNSAAAGRFENLIWGIEFRNGAERLISWHLDSVTDAIVRTQWRDERGNNTCVLRPFRRNSYGGIAPATQDDAAIQAAVDLMLAP